MPVEHDLAPVAAEKQGQSRHGVGMVDMNDIIVAHDAAELPHHGRRNHRCGHLGDAAGADHACTAVEGDLARGAVEGSTKHVATNPPLGEPLHEGIHHLLHPALDRIELT